MHNYDPLQYGTDSLTTKCQLRRLTAERVRRFVDHLRQTNTPHSVAIQMDSLYGAARTLMPNKDWLWSRDIKTRLY
ncbi:MAG: hypothetical protein WCD69_07015 [Xanthobacteraceae bacterium]